MKGIIKDGKVYYKYVYGTFTQPTPTSDGIIGSPNSMAFGISFSGANWTRGPAYAAFLPYGNGVGFYCDEYKGHLTLYMYLPKPTRLTGINITNFSTWDGAASGCYNTQLWGGRLWGWQDELVSNIGYIAERTTRYIDISTPNYYQYFRLYMENYGGPDNDQLEVRNIRLDGVTREVVEGTPDDYDFYVDTFTADVIYKDEKYYAFNSYEKGQYFN